MTPPVIERFDGLAVWAKLSEDHRRHIGSLALELMVAWYGAEQAALKAWQGPVDRANLEASDAVSQLLQQAFVAAVPRDLLHGAERLPRVPLSLGPVCRGCGCSDNDVCEDVCAWADEDVCTACKAQGVS